MARLWEMASALAAAWPKVQVPKAVLRPPGASAEAAEVSGTGWPEAAAAYPARRSAGPAVSAGQAEALPPEEPEVGVEAPREEAEAGVAAPHGEAAAVAEVPREEGAAAVAAPHEEAAAAVGAPREGKEAVAAEAPHEEEAVAGARAGVAAVAQQRAAPDAAAAVLPSAAAWAFRRDQVLPWLAPSPSVRFAHATARLSIASP